MPNAATIAIRGENAQLKSTLGESEGLLNQFGSKVKTAMVAVGAAFAIKEAFQLGKFFVDAASDAEDSEAKLVQALKAPGYAAGFTAEQLSTMADRLQEVTKFEGDATKESLALLTSFNNIRGDVFVQATKAAMDMSTVFGGPLEGEILKLGKALNNPIEGLQALGRAGIKFTDQQKHVIEKLVESGDVAAAQGEILKELESRFGGAAEAAGSTFSGQMEIAKNKLGDIAETIGGFLIPVLEEMQPVFDGVITGLENMTPAIKYVMDYWIGFAHGAVDAAKTLFEYIKEGGLHAFTAFQMALVDSGAMVEQIMLGITLDSVRAFEVLKHWLTEALPEYMAWFGKNWQNILTDIGDFQNVVLTNMGTNFVDFFKAVQGWLSGEGFNFEFTGLTDGFKSTIEELPKIAERIPTLLERELQTKLDAVTKSLANDYDQLLKQNREALDSLFTKDSKPKLDLSNTAVKVDASQFDDVPKVKKVKEEKAVTEKVDREVKETKIEGPKEEKKEDDTGETSSRFESLEGANKRIQEAAASLTGKEDKQKALISSNDRLITSLDGLTQAVGEPLPPIQIPPINLPTVKAEKTIGEIGKSGTSDMKLLLDAANKEDVIPELPDRKSDLELLAGADMPPPRETDLEFLVGAAIDAKLPKPEPERQIMRRMDDTDVAAFFDENQMTRVDDNEAAAFFDEQPQELPSFREMPMISVDVPQLQSPELPELAFGELEIPELAVDVPQLQSPELPELAFDELPMLDVPQLSVDVPQLESPEITVSELPSLDVPELAVDVPQLESPELPMVSFGELPTMDVPQLSVDVPEFDVPTVTATNFEDANETLHAAAEPLPMPQSNEDILRVLTISLQTQNRLLDMLDAGNKLADSSRSELKKVADNIDSVGRLY